MAQGGEPTRGGESAARSGPGGSRRGAPDLRTPELPVLDWSAGASFGSLTELFRRAERQVLTAVDWYLVRRKANSRWSRRLRAIALLLASGGVVVPLVHSAAPHLLSAEWGYVLLAGSAASVLFDRFFGFSSSWMRFVQAEMALQQALSTAQFDWVAAVAALRGAEPSDAQREELLGVIRQLCATSLQTIQDETTTWIADLSAGLEELNRSASTSGLQPGGR